MMPDPLLPAPDLGREESHLAPYGLDSLTGARVLVLAPHPDDEVFGCGGALRLHALARDPVKILVLTDGRHGHRPGAVDGDALAERRRAETCAAAAVLGTDDLEFWPAPDRSLGRDAGAAQRLAEVLEAYRPDLVYCPSPLEHHPDHRAAAWVLWQNASRLPRGARIAFYEISRPLAVNTLVDIGPVVAEKRRAAEAHASQLAVSPYPGIIAALNRYRSLTVADRATDVEGYFVTPAANLIGEAMSAFHGWQLDPLGMRLALGEPRVSVVVRTLNRPALLREALASVSAQTGVKTEVLVVNDGGCPVGAVVDEFRDELPLRLLEHPRTLGRAAAANSGLRSCRGRFVNFLDDDDVFLPGHLGKLADFLDTTGESVAYSDVVPLSCVDPRGCVPGAPYDREFDPQLLRLQNYLPIHAVAFRRSVLAEVGPFDESLQAMEDWDFWIRLSARHRFHRVPGVTACYRSFSPHGHDWLQWQRRIYEKHHAPGELVEHVFHLTRHCERIERDLLRQAAEALAARAAADAAGAAAAAAREEAAAREGESLAWRAEAAALEETLRTMRETIVWRLGSAVTRLFPAKVAQGVHSRLIRLLARNR